MLRGSDETWGLLSELGSFAPHPCVVAFCPFLPGSYECVSFVAGSDTRAWGADAEP
jgi:hypothetical protein